MKKNFKILLFVYVLLILCSITAFAELVEGDCGVELKWSLDTDSGELNISGAGEMDSSPWRDGYSDLIKKVNITSEVTSIVDFAFYMCNNLTEISVDENNYNYSSDKNGILYNRDKSVLICCPILSDITSFSIPQMVTTIQPYAFRGCKNLTSLNISNNVTNIGKAAFSLCINLNEVSLPDSIDIIEEALFEECYSLESIILPRGINSIGNYSFQWCTNLKNVTILGNPSFIGNYAFYNCNELTNINMPYGIKSIGEGAFYNCYNLSDFVIPDSVESIGYVAFYYCQSFSKIEIPYGITNLNATFSNCVNLTNVILPESITCIGDDTFAFCTSLEKIDIPKNVKSIGQGAFYRCENLETIIFSDGLESIGPIAFAYCVKLKDVQIPETVTTIRNEAFYGCSSLEHIAIPNSVSVIELNVLASCNNVIIHGQSGSVAEVYAKNNYIKFKSTSSCENHKYNATIGGVCSVCGYVYEIEYIELNKIMQSARTNTPIRNQPYSAQGEIVQRLSKGETVVVTHKLVNAVGNVWYLTEDGLYIYENNLQEVSGTYSITYDGNGNGVTNLPLNSCGKKLYKHTIPGRIDGAPIRNGYTFVGYSTDKNAITAQYNIGDGIYITKDVILYAIWKENSVSYTYDISRFINQVLNGTSNLSSLGDSGPKYWSWYNGKTSTREDSWCAVYMSYILYQNGVFGLKSANCNTQVKRLKSSGCFYSSKDYIPKTGDLVFFTKNGTGADHVGMVVVDNNGVINILQGNYSRKVKYTKMSAVWTTSPKRYFNNSILGYGDIEAYAALLSK